MAWKSASSPLTGCTACETSNANALSATIAALLARSAACLPACLLQHCGCGEEENRVNLKQRAG
jgi:hypothetical protein